MKIAVEFRSETVDVQVPEPLENSAGKVDVRSTWAYVEPVIDAAMRAAGVTRIKTVGAVKTINGRKGLEVETNKGRILVALDTRPELAALIENCDKITSKIERARSRKSEAFRATEKAADDLLRDEMRAKAAAIATQIPTDHIHVTATNIGNVDGDAIMSYTAEGVDLHPGQITRHGWASAIRPGAGAAFDEIQIVSISRADLEAIKMEAEAKAAAKLGKEKEEASQLAAAFAQAKSTGRRVEIARYTDECSDPREECSLDIVTVYAMPDGSQSESREHTY